MTSVNSNGNVTTYAGADGIFLRPQGVSVYVSNGAVLIADTGNHLICLIFRSVQIQ